MVLGFQQFLLIFLRKEIHFGVISTLKELDGVEISLPLLKRSLRLLQVLVLRCRKKHCVQERLECYRRDKLAQLISQIKVSNNSDPVGQGSSGVGSPSLLPRAYVFGIATAYNINQGILTWLQQSFRIWLWLLISQALEAQHYGFSQGLVMNPDIWNRNLPHA